MGSIARELLIEALSMAKVKISKRVKGRVTEGLCLIPACDCAAVGRGLCEKHRNAYYRELNKLKTATEQLEFEQALIRRGLILPAGAQLTIKKQSESPFSIVDSESA